MFELLTDRSPALDSSRYVPKVIEDGVIFNGSCRCGGVQYSSTARPKDVTFCHCRACQQLSGSAFLPFTGVPKDALTFTEESTRRTLRLSDFAERSYCSRCGAPITMIYAFEPQEISLTLSSVDLNSMKCEPPTLKQHIFLQEKAPWFVLADDGAERWGTCEDAHVFKSQKL